MRYIAIDRTLFRREVFEFSAQNAGFAESFSFQKSGWMMTRESFPNE